MLGQVAADPTDRKRLRAMARGVMDAWPKPAASSDDSEEAPSLAGQGGQPPSMLHMFAGLARVPCVRRGYSGRLVSACACVSSYLAGDGRSTGAALNELVEKHEAGPLVLVPLSMLFAMTNNDRPAKGLRELARRRWSFDALWNDAADVFANFPSLAEVPAKAGAAFRRDPDLRRLFAELPDGPDQDVRAFRVAVRYWWSQGGEGMLEKLLLD